MDKDFRKENSAANEPYEYELVVAIPRGNGDWYKVETGLGAMIDEDNKHIVLPFWDGVNAEEVGRIITGMVRRELS